MKSGQVEDINNEYGSNGMENGSIKVGKITNIIPYRKTFNNAAFFTDSCLHLRFTRMYPRIPRENETGFIFRYDGVWR